MKGKPELQYSTKFSLKTPGVRPTPMDRATYYKMYDEAWVNDGIVNHYLKPAEDYFLNGYDGVIYPGLYPGQKDYVFQDHNFVEYGLRNTMDQMHNLSIKGGNENITYYSSIGYIEDNSILKFGENNYKKLTINSKLT